MSRVIIAAVFCCSLACFAQTSAAPSDLTATLKASSKSVFDAEKSKDTAALKRLLAADFQEVGSEGKLHPLGDLLGDVEDGKLLDFSIYNAQVISIDDSTAVVTYDAIIHMPEGDDGLAPRYQRFSDIWTRQGGEWKLKFRQSTARRPID